MTPGGHISEGEAGKFDITMVINDAQKSSGRTEIIPLGNDLILIEINFYNIKTQP